VGHILPHKGYDDLVQALALVREKFPNVKCLIVGGASRARYLQRLLQLAERLSVRDRLVVVGFQEDVVPFLHAMDVFVLPSRTEGLPITILEAMAAGKPVVATAVGGIPEVVRDGETGFLTPPGDPDRLAEAVIRLLEAPTLATAMGEAGRKRVESEFTLDGEARQTSTVYHQVLAASSPRSTRQAGSHTAGHSNRYARSRLESLTPWLFRESFAGLRSSEEGVGASVGPPNARASSY